jgi:hypothetical protein
MKTLYKAFPVLVILLSSCLNEESPIIENDVPDMLKIEETVGLSVESYFVYDNIRMNVKVDKESTYVIKLLHISGRTVVKDVINVVPGDNLKVLYVNAIPKEPYTLALYNNEDQQLAKTIISIF